MTTIAHISLLAAALLDLCAMLRLETAALQRNAFSNSRFYTWLRESGELISPKRLLVFAVLIACCTTMARTSWMVVMLLAIVLAVQGIVLAFHKGAADDEKASKRSWIAGIIAFVLAVLGTGGAAWLGNLSSEVEGLKAASIAAVILLAISPLLAMLANSLLGRYKNRDQEAENSENDKS